MFPTWPQCSAKQKPRRKSGLFDLGGIFKAPPEVPPVDQYFGDSANSLIARAAALAQQCGSAEVVPEHVLVSASPEGLEQTGLSRLRRAVEDSLPRVTPLTQGPEFSPDVRRLFERAFRIAEGKLEEHHLLLNLELKSLNYEGQGFGLGHLFSPELATLLESRGVKVKRLLAEVGELDLMAALDTDYFQTKVGQRALDLVPSLQPPGAGHCAVLLMLCLRPGTVQQTLYACGLTDALLIDSMVELLRVTVDGLLSSCNLDSVGVLAPVLERLNRPARLALIIGWNCSGRKTLDAQDLLVGILGSDMLCHPGNGATQVLHHLGVFGFAHRATGKWVLTHFNANLRIPELSEQVRMALQAAAEVSVGCISTEHLLYGLSSVGTPELLETGVDPEAIRRSL